MTNGNYELAPNNSGGALKRYIEHGILPGSFLEAILRNDFEEACSRADDVNKRLIWEYVYWLYNYAPMGCWGSPELVTEWVRVVHGRPV